MVACIPAFNEEKTIASVIVRARKYVDKVVVCDDGSVDLTGEIAKGLGAVVVQHKHNMGYGAALQSLFKEARRLEADITVTLDGDGQHNPEEIPRLVKQIQEGNADLVIGSRFLEGSHSEAPRWRRAGIRLITDLASNGLHVTDAQSGFRAYSIRALESLELSEDGMGVSTEILLKAFEKDMKVAEVPINVRYYEGSSKHNPLVHGIGVVLSTVKYMSLRRPLLFYGVPGFISFVAALVFWVWTFQIYSATKRIVTNIALIGIGSTLIGLMLTTTAMILWVLISIVRPREDKGACIRSNSCL